MAALPLKELRRSVERASGSTRIDWPPEYAERILDRYEKSLGVLRGLVEAINPEGVRQPGRVPGLLEEAKVALLRENIVPRQEP